MDSKYIELIKLIKKAQGNRTLNQFALATDIDAGHLSRLLKGNFVNPPIPDTLKKISDHSHNEVSYESLLRAAHYIDDSIKLPQNYNVIDNKQTIEDILKEKGLDEKEINVVQTLIDTLTNNDN